MIINLLKRRPFLVSQLTGCCVLLTLSVIPAVAQTDPVAARILEKVSETYTAASRYEVRAVLRLTEPDANPRSVSAHLYYRRPDMYRLEVHATLAEGQSDQTWQAKDEFLFVFNGSTLWSYFPKLNTYSTFTGALPEAATPHQVEQFPGFAPFRDLKEILNGRQARVIGEEQLAISSTSTVDCYVVRISDPIGTKVLWIEKGKYYVRREDDAHDGKAAGSAVYNMIELNLPLANDLFSFDPPPGARKVAPE